MVDGRIFLLIEDKFNSGQASYRSSVQSQIRELTDQRRTLRNALRRTGADNPEQIQAQITALTRPLSKLHQERGLCDEIAVHSEELPQRPREAEQEKAFVERQVFERE